MSFSAGLATTLAALGVFSTTLGRAYGQIGSGLPVAVSVVAVLMGMNLLEVRRAPISNPNPIKGNAYLITSWTGGV